MLVGLKKGSIFIQIKTSCFKKKTETRFLIIETK